MALSSLSTDKGIGEPSNEAETIEMQFLHPCLQKKPGWEVPKGPKRASVPAPKTVGLEDTRPANDTVRVSAAHDVIRSCFLS